MVKGVTSAHWGSAAARLPTASAGSATGGFAGMGFGWGCHWPGPAPGTYGTSAAAPSVPRAVIVLASRMEWPPFAPLRRAPDGVVIARHRQGACQAVG